MEAPKCKLCGERHYGICGGASEAQETAPARTKGQRGASFLQKWEAVIKETPLNLRKPVTRPKGIGQNPSGRAESEVVTASEEITPKPKFDRGAYQRDLMRKRRAADKAVKAGHATDTASASRRRAPHGAKRPIRPATDF